MKKTKGRKKVLTPVLVQNYVSFHGKYCSKKCSHLEFHQIANSVFLCTLFNQHLKGREKVTRCEECNWSVER